MEDIEGRSYEFDLYDSMQATEVRCTVETYSCNGTLAVPLMCRPEMPEDIPEEVPDDLKFDESYGVVTVNLPESDNLAPNVQFVDENNFPGIGEWLARNGIAQPTDVLARSGWCGYQAYEFNISPEKFREVLDRRMAVNPEKTREVMCRCLEGTLADIKEDLQSCMTLGEVSSVYESMPKELRNKVSVPDRFTTSDGKELTAGQMEERKFTGPLPDDLPAMSYDEARRKFDERKAALIPEGSPVEIVPMNDGEMIRTGSVEMNQVMHRFPSEYSNPFLVEVMDHDGRLKAEFFAITNSYAENLKCGLSLRHLPNGVTVCTSWSADKTSDNSLKNGECLFSRKGSLIGAGTADINFDHDLVGLTPDYSRAVETCSKAVCRQLDTILAETVNEIRNQNNTRGIRR